MFPILEFDICRIFWMLLFLVVLILFFDVSQLGDNQNEAQIIDVQKVSSCPSTKGKWLKDAATKNCSSRSITFKYHCLLNHWRNQSYVLCGEDKYIIGFYCPEYDERRGRIQENYKVKCTYLNHSCPIMYNSSAVYKYPACINTNINDTSNRSTKENIEEIIDYNDIKWNLMVISIQTTVFSLMAILMLLCLRKRLRNFKDGDLSNIYDDEYPWSASELSSLFDVQDTRKHFAEIRSSKKDYSTFGTDFEYPRRRSYSKFPERWGTYLNLHRFQRRSYERYRLDAPWAEWNQRIHYVVKEELSNYIIKEPHQLQPTSDLSFTKELLHGVNLRDVLHEVELLSKEVILNNTIETTANSNEHGKVYVAEVTVTSEKNELNVNIKDSYGWKRFLQAKQKDQVKVILIHSKSLRVIEAKLKVYREYKTDIDSSNIFLQHVYDDFGEVSKLSVHNKLTWLLDAVKSLRWNMYYLYRVVKTFTDIVLTEKTILKLCQKESVSSHTFYHSLGKEKLLRTLQIAVDALGSMIYIKISKRMHAKLQIQKTSLLLLKFKIRKILMKIFISSFSRSEYKYLKSMETLEDVAINISSQKSYIWKEIFRVIKATENDLKDVSRILYTAIGNLSLIDHNEAVKTWQKREALQCLQGLKSHSSVLKHIAGWKDGEPTIKVFLSHDDTGAIDFFKHNNQIPKGTCFEFVNVAEKSKEIFKSGEDNLDYSSFSDDNNMKTKLGEVINKHAQKLYAKHSGIVGLDAGNMFFEGKMEPCIIIYSLDKDLIPYGEDPLPKTIDGWHCHVREDIVMFGMCFDCRQITHPNPGCCIGLPSNGIGSAGFLVKSKGSGSPVTGFLTAAHVAARNWTDLYDFNELLSNIVSSDCRDEIVHPLLPDYTQYQVIGKVRESFCGNLGEGFGIDAAFVENSEPRQGEMSELQIADETILLFDLSKVIKRGGATGETEGLLTGNTFSVCVDKDFNFGGFYYFARCFSIKSIGRPFFERGDSGSGVFLMENGKPTKPIGIAFAKLLINHKTAVCRIDKIVEAFGLSVYQNEEPMEI